MIENEYIYETEEGILIDELDNSKLILLPELLNKNYEKLEKYYIELIMPHDMIDEMNQTIIFTRDARLQEQRAGRFIQRQKLLFCLSQNLKVRC